MPDGQDAFPKDAKESADSDKDGIGDNADPDDDNDGIPDEVEIAAKTDPKKVDTDADGLNDKEEQDKGANPLKADSDDDTIPDGEEVLIINTNPAKADTDDDGVGDGKELERRTDPTNPDTDGDGIKDGDDTAPLYETEQLLRTILLLLAFAFSLAALGFGAFAIYRKRLAEIYTTGGSARESGRSAPRDSESDGAWKQEEEEIEEILEEERAEKSGLVEKPTTKSRRKKS